MSRQQSWREVYKDSYSRLFSSLYARFKDIDLVEDAIHDSFERALKRDEDLPQKPDAWLYVSAKNRILDRLKKHSSKNHSYDETLHRQNENDQGEADFGDEIFSIDVQFRLMCMTCHPALSRRVRIILTLRLVAGLSVEEIAVALVMKPASVAQALTRAKGKIKRAGIPFAIADQAELGKRIESVHLILYLMFNEGYYSNSENNLFREDLCNEAIRLARLLLDLDPNHNDSRYLLSQMLFLNSRLKARVNADGEPVLLEAQNRNLWNLDLIAEADRLFTAELASVPDNPSRYFFFAAIAREYALSKDFASSNWSRICLLYSNLYYLDPDPVVLLSWLVAESYRTSPAIALELMNQHKLDEHLHEYRWYHAARAELEASAGQMDSSLAHFCRALELSVNPAERKHLKKRQNQVMLGK